MNKTRKGFTIVELVIVIAVIAILAAVLMPTFTNIINKANTAADMQIVANLNKALATEKAYQTGADYLYPQNAFAVAKEYGYSVEKIVAKSNLNIAYDHENKRFVLLDETNNTITYPTDDDTKELYVSEDDRVNYFVVRSTNESTYEGIIGKDEDQNVVYSQYSIYAGYKFNATKVVLHGVGFDSGSINTIEEVVYENNSGNAKDVLIRTNSFQTVITVDGPQDTVSHFGYAASVVVKHIKASSWDEFGIVGRVEVQDGHVEAMDGCEVFCLMEDGANVTPTTVNEGATVHPNKENINAAVGITKDETTGVANGHIDDCGAGKHTFSKLIIDNEHIYDVCTCCGYTLISIQDDLGNETKQTKNNLVLEAEGEGTGVDGERRYVVATDDKGNPLENVTPVMTYETHQDIDIDSLTGENYEIAKDKENKEIVVSEEINVENMSEEEKACDHSFTKKVTKEATCTEAGLMNYSCTKCGASYNVVMPKIAHRFYDNMTGKVYSGDDTCSLCGKTRQYYYPNGYIVTNVNGKDYKTLSLALADAPTDGTVFKIKLLNDDAIKADDSVASTQNGYWNIKAGQNVVIDLNGYSLKNLITCSTFSRVFYINEGATLTIMDSSDINKDGTGTGKLFNDLNNGVQPGEWKWTNEGKENYNFSTNVFDNFGTLNIKSGYISNPILSNICYVVDYKGVTNISGGCIESNSASGIRLYANSGSHPIVNITGGELKCKEHGYIFYCHKDATESSSGTLNITGGHFSYGELLKKFVDTSIGLSDTFDISITGGEFSGDVTPYCPEELFSKNYNGTYKIVSRSLATDEDCTAKIGDIRYFNFDSAFDAVQEGQTIKLFKDITFKGYQTWNFNINFTIDLNGHALIGENYTSNANYFLYSSYGTGSITFENGIIDHPGNYSLLAYGTKFYLDSVILTEGTKIYQDTDNCTFYIGGTYNEDVANFVADGYVSVNNKNGTYTVVPALYMVTFVKSFDERIGLFSTKAAAESYKQTLENNPDYNSFTFVVSDTKYIGRYYYVYSAGSTYYKGSAYDYAYDTDHLFDTAEAALENVVTNKTSKASTPGYSGAYTQEVYELRWSGNDTFVYGYYATEEEANNAIAQCIFEMGQNCNAQVVAID